MNLIFKARILALLGTAAFQMAIDNPAGFSKKVYERLRIENPVLNRLHKHLPKSSIHSQTHAEELLNRGEIAATIQTVLAEKNPSWAETRAAKTAFEKLQQLETAPPIRNHTQGSTSVRVLHVLTNSLPYTQSGYTVRSHNILKAQKAAGVQVAAITRIGYPVTIGKIPRRDQEYLDSVSYYRILPMFWSSSNQRRQNRAVQELVKKAQKFKATILHTTTDFSNAIIVSKASAILGIPWIYEIRGELESTWLSKIETEHQEAAANSDFYKLARRQETRFMKNADAIVTLSEVYKNELVERGIKPSKITVIPNCIKSEELRREVSRADIRKALQLPTGRLVGTISSLVSYEGIDDLLRARVCASEDFDILIVGEGEARPKLQNLAKELGIEQWVHFAGRQSPDEIWKWYAALDVFVLPRKDLPVTRKVTPIKALHAQALGIPVIASDLPAIREVTGGMETYVSPGKPGELANAIQNEFEFKRIRNSKQWANSRTWEWAAIEYERLYRKILT